MVRATARELCAAAAFGAFLTTVAVPIRAQKAAAEEPRTDIPWGVKIPMRDGVSSINSTGTQKKNYNRGGVVAAETGKDAKTAHINLIHDAEHPSRLELPIVRP